MLKWFVLWTSATLLSCSSPREKNISNNHLTISPELEAEFKWLYYSMNYDAEVSVYSSSNRALVSDTSSLLSFDLTMRVEKCDSLRTDIIIYPELPDTVFSNLKGRNFPILSGFHFDKKRNQILPIFEGGQLDVGLKDSLFVLRRTLFERLIRFDQVEIEAKWLSSQASRMRWELEDSIQIKCQ